MSHYAKIENGIVVQVNVIEDDYFYSNPDRYTGQWVKTSYNTRGGIHYDPNSGQPSNNQSYNNQQSNYQQSNYPDEQIKYFLS